MATHNSKSISAKTSNTPAGKPLADVLDGILIDGYVPARLPAGKVVGVWGQAVRRTLEGELHPLVVGDEVHKGDVIFTSQDGIVQLEEAGTRFARLPDPDGLVIAEAPLTFEAPAAGNTGGGDGSLQAGEFLQRVNESTTPSQYSYDLSSGGLTFPTANTTGNTSLPSLAVSSPSVLESGGFIVFTVGISAPQAQDTPLTLSLSNGTATGGGVDFGSAAPGVSVEVSTDGGATWVSANTASIPAGQTSLLVRAPVTQDALNEANETLVLTATPAANTTANGAVTGTGTIVDDDPAPSLSVNSIDVNEAAGTATLTVTLSAPSGQQVAVNWGTVAGTATAGSDFTSVNGVLVFAPGETTKTVSVPIINDAVFEGSETLNVTLTNPTNATLNVATGVITIHDDGTGTVPPGVTPDDDRPAVGSVTSPTVVEGNNLDFTVTLTHGSTTPTTVTLTPASGTATLGTDTEPAQVSFDGGSTFVAVSGPTVSVPAGSTSFIVRVPTVNDTLGEPTEQMTLAASTPVNAAPVVGTGTITDNDTPVVSISGPVTYNEAAGTASYTVSLSNPATTAVSVQYATSDGTASAGADYTAAADTLTFAPGETSKVVTVAIANDTVFEGPETFSVTLSAPVGATLGTASSLTTITDDGTGTVPPGVTPDDDRPAVGSVTSPTVVEGNNLDFTVTLTHGSTTPTTVTLTPASGTATLGTDTEPALVSFDGGTTFTPISGPTVSVPAGSTSFIVRVPTVNDTLGEPTEQMTLAASTPQNSAPVVGTGTITDNDTPVVSISGPVTYNEAAGTASYTVSLSNPATTAVSVQYATSDGTASAGADYTAAADTLTFAPGETSKVVTVAITNDTVFEGPETFSVTLSAPVGATLGTASSLTTITDDGTGTVPPGVTPDDDRPAVGSVTSPTVVEGNNLDFTVTLTHGSTTPTTVTLTPASGTATLGTDTEPAQVSFDGGSTFVAVSGPTVSVPAGSTSFIVRVPTVNDTLGEPTEQMTLAASTPQNSAPVVGTGTITDNDTPVVSISGPVTYNEAAGTASYTVSLSNPATTAVSVQYATSDGTASAGADYTAAADTLTFAPGETSKVVTVAITNDTVFEGPETFSVTLSAPVGATLGTASSLTTITDDGTGTVPPGVTPDDDRPAVGSVTSPTVVEGNNLDFTVTLTHGSTTPTTVTLTPASGTATLGTDTEPALVSFDGGTTFTPISGPTVSVPAGSTSFIVRVPTVNDTLGEPTEQMTLAASTPQNSAPVVGTGTITDNDTPVVSISGPVTYNEAAGTASYTVSLSNPATTAVSVQYATSDGTASAGADYTAAADTLTFAPGETSKVVTVAITNDTVFEGPETFSVTLSAPVGATLGTASSLTTITDDGTGTVPPGVTPDDDRPAVGSVTSPTVVEGNNLDFTVTLTHGSTTPTTVTLTPASGTATLGVDTTGVILVSFDNGATFTALSGLTVTVPANTTSFVVRMPTVNDVLQESTEQFTLDVATAQNATPVTGTGTILDNDHAPTIAGPGAAALSEMGLAITGVRAATPALISVSGSLTIADADGDPLTVTLTAPTQTVTSNGVALVWTGVGTNALVGSAGGEPVITVDINNSGQYTVQLLGHVDHLGANQATLPLDIGVRVSDGQFTTNGSVNVTVADDAPTAPPSQTAHVTVQDTNLLLVLDISGSMDATDGVNNSSRLKTAADAISKLLDAYDAAGDVKVSLVTFSSGAQQVVAGGTVSQVKTALDSLVANGSTNYDAAISQAETTFNGASKIVGGQNVAYFFSDGEPNQPNNSPGMNGAEQAAWQTYLQTNDMKAFAIGLGSGVSTGALNPIAYDGLNESDPASGTIAVTNLNNLDTALAGTVPASLSGQLVAGSVGLNGAVGADGGYIQSVTVGGVSITYAPGDAATKVIDTGNATLTVDMTTGVYTYVPKAAAPSTFTETASYVVSDRDGDTAGSTITFDAQHLVAGGAGSNVVIGTANADLVRGGAGNDTLTGGLGSDVFAWSLADKGAVGNPAKDTVTDFNLAQGDRLNLADLLQNDTVKTAASLDHFLDFTVSGGTTTIHVSTAGAFNGSNTAAVQDQTIALNNVDLHTALGATPSTDAQIIQTLLDQGKLLVQQSGG